MTKKLVLSFKKAPFGDDFFHFEEEHINAQIKAFPLSYAEGWESMILEIYHNQKKIEDYINDNT